MPFQGSKNNTPRAPKTIHQGLQKRYTKGSKNNTSRAPKTMYQKPKIIGYFVYYNYLCFYWVLS
jgi:hypothetical protein